jgi:hypothetical protein
MTMKKAMNLLIVGIAGLSLQGIAFARNTPDSKQDKSARPSTKVKTPAQRADTDSCKVTKQEWMNFMASEFDTLANNSGEIDLSKRRQENGRIVPFSSLGK